MINRTAGGQVGFRVGVGFPELAGVVLSRQVEEDPSARETDAHFDWTFSEAVCLGGTAVEADCDCSSHNVV